MKKFSVTGLSTHGAWPEAAVETIAERVRTRAAEKGIVEITNVEEVK